MRVAWKRQAAMAVQPEAAESDRTLEGDVVELRSVDNFRVCSECLVVNSAADAYCTGCGNPLPLPADGESTVAPVLVKRPLPQPSPPDVRIVPRGPTKLRPRHWAAIVGVVVLVASGASGTAVFAWKWHKEDVHSHALAAGLASARVRVAATQQKLAGAEASLRQATAIAEKRKTVLLQAQTVLARVDPLFSSVDELQKRTADIQSERDRFTIDAETLIGNAVALASYLIQTDPSYIDYGYGQGLIDVVNGNLETVRADESNLGGSDSSYRAASDRFRNGATGFSKAVRALQRQLRDVAAK